MGRYAVVVTDTGYVYGVNALVNSLKYYGNEVDFHHLYYGSKAHAQSMSLKECGEFNFFPYNLVENWQKPEVMNGRKISPAWVCKFYRYLYCATEMAEYDAVAIFDADMMVVNNIMKWFDVAAKTKRIVLPNNDLSGLEQDCYNVAKIKGASSPPLHNMPMFFDPKIVQEVFLNMINIHIEVGLSDMASLNYSLIQTGEIDRAVALPNCLWLVSHPSNIKLFSRMINGKPTLLLHRTGDRVNAIHKPWWDLGYCGKIINGGMKFVKGKIDKKTRQSTIHYSNSKLFWEMNKFLNTELYHKAKWKDEVFTA